MGDGGELLTDNSSSILIGRPTILEAPMTQPPALKGRRCRYCSVPAKVTIPRGVHGHPGAARAGTGGQRCKDGSRRRLYPARCARELTLSILPAGAAEQNTVDGLIGIQVSISSSSSFAEVVSGDRRRGQAHFFTCFALAADINLRGRVAAVAPRPAQGRVFRPQREPSLFRNLRADLLRNRLPSIIFLLPSEDSICIFTERG